MLNQENGLESIMARCPCALYVKLGRLGMRGFCAMLGVRIVEDALRMFSKPREDVLNPDAALKSVTATLSLEQACDRITGLGVFHHTRQKYL